VLADAEPWWEPDNRFGYHALTFGFVLGEMVRRATGRPLSWWLRESLTSPLGVEDEVHFGVPETLLGRAARARSWRQGRRPSPPSPARRGRRLSRPLHRTDHRRSEQRWMNR
jgi:CubicO group peptidase (beta-lactamase class C family)